jgi:coatomer subunit beta'
VFDICLGAFWQINQKAAESLADPEEYPNLFPDWESALAAESELREQR